MKIKIKDRDVESAKVSDVADSLILSEKKNSVKKPIRFYSFPLLVAQNFLIGLTLLLILVILFLYTWEISQLDSDIQELSYNFNSRLNGMESFITMLESEKEEEEDMKKPIFFDFNTGMIQYDSGNQKDGTGKKESGIHGLDYFDFGNGEDSEELDDFNRVIITKISHSALIDESMNSSTNSSNQINAANALFGAFINEKLSSPSVSPGDGFLDKVSDFFGATDGNYVLLDRENLPINKAWCSDEEDSILAIQLSHSITPMSISYQHSKWNGTVPNGAPKNFDAMGCLDVRCDHTVELASHCYYNSDNQSTQEQVCKIKPHHRVSGVKAVQFQFRENHGNVEKTCAYLFRVYGEIDQNQKSEPVSRIKDISDRDEMCSLAAEKYYSLPSFLYKALNFNCTKLYSNDCCSYCPECCTECKMSFGFIEETYFVVSVLIIVMGIVLFMAYLSSRLAKCCGLPGDLF